MERADASAEDITRGRALIAEAKALQERAADLKAIAEQQAVLKTSERSRPVADNISDRSEETAEVREMKALDAYCVDQNEVKFRAALNAGGVADGSANGPALIPSYLQKRIIDVIDKQGPMLNPENVTVIDSPDGNESSIGRGDDRGATAYVVAEGAAHPDTEVTFDKVTFKAYEYGTGLVAITHKMERDNVMGLGIGNYVIGKLGLRFGRSWNEDATNGNGTTRPEGLVTGLAAADAEIETATSAGWTFQDLMNAEDALEEGYHENAYWMLSRKHLNQFRALTTSTGEPAVFQGNYANGVPPSILGRRYVINNRLPDDVLILGDIKEAFAVRRIGTVDFKTSTEVFFRQNMKCVAGFAALDSRVINPAAALIVRRKAA
ncbi:phage major capsid protein [Brevundimonas sp.]|uniref:phage major capsid protein n=1 Tax=Brevundimonas sp. TaxID=1871086 RepID=UPI0035B1CB9B